MERIKVDAQRAGAHEYDVLIEPGILSRLGEYARRLAPAHRYVLITDENVARLWASAALDSLSAAGLRTDLLTFPAGEAAKTRQTWARLSDEMLALGVGRDSVTIALGGGVVGDLAGFVAASYMRGLPLIQVPTSLLAMIDASVGGKTGVDVGAGKNLIGAFHQPLAVLIDPQLLSTLPEAERVGGLAEAIKHGAIADRGYFDWLARHAAALTAPESPLHAHLIAESVRIKASFISRDPLEHGPRAGLNFGHTIGHALELASDYTLPHGHAVAIGMRLESELGEQLGVTEKGTASELERVLQLAGLPTRAPAQLRAISAAHDKKARAGNVRCTLLARIGKTARAPGGEWTFEVDPATVAAVIAAARDPSPR